MGMRNEFSSWRSLGVLHRSLQTPGTSFTGYQIVAKLPLTEDFPGKPLAILFFPTDCHFGVVCLSFSFEHVGEAAGGSFLPSEVPEHSFKEALPCSRKIIPTMLVQFPAPDFCTGS